MSTRGDFCYSSTWNRPLFFPVLEVFAWPIETYDRFMTRNITESLEYGPADVTISRLDVLEAVEQLYTLTINIQAYKPGIGNKFPIANGIYLVEHKLSSINNMGLVTEHDFLDPIYDISESLALAAQIFLHIAIREVPREAKRHRSLYDRLKASIPNNRDFSIILAPRSLSNLLVWIFFVGAADSQDRTARNFCVFSLKQLCFSLNIKSWDEFRDCLKDTMWSEPFSPFHAMGLWNEIAPSLTEALTSMNNYRSQGG
jgi:hypothetical protein